MEQFRVDPATIGIIVGSKGVNIRRAQALPGVHRIDVREDGVVSIMADTPQAGKEARALLEVSQDRMKVQMQDIGIIIGRGGQQIRDLEQISGCRITIQAGSDEVVITGLKNSVEKAKALLTYTVETHNEQREKEQQIKSLSQELYQLGVMPVDNAAYYGGSGPVYGRGGQMVRGRGRGAYARVGGAVVPAMGPRGGARGGRGAAAIPPQQAARGARGGAAAAGVTVQVVSCPVDTVVLGWWGEGACR